MNYKAGDIVKHRLNGTKMLILRVSSLGSNTATCRYQTNTGEFCRHTFYFEEIEELTPTRKAGWFFAFLILIYGVLIGLFLKGVFKNG